MVGEDQTDRQKQNSTAGIMAKRRCDISNMVPKTKYVCTFSFVFSLTCDKLICKQPMCDELIDKSMVVWYTNKQNQKRVYVNEKKANVCRFPCLTLRCDPHDMRQEFTVCQIKSHFSIVCRFSLFSPNKIVGKAMITLDST